MSAIVAKVRRAYRRTYIPSEWDYVNASHNLLGRNLLAEDDLGCLLVPSKTNFLVWDRLYNPRNPFHWRYWVASRLSGQVVMVELKRV